MARHRHLSNSISKCGDERKKEIASHFHAGMARHRHLSNSISKCADERKKEIASHFSKSWCGNEVLCSGGFAKPRWKLAPSLIIFPQLSSPSDPGGLFVFDSTLSD
jgi:hypothetical protein